MVRRLALILAAGLLLAPAASAAQPDILFSASPKNVQIVKSGKALRLVMPANSRTTWFTDRPERKAGSTNLRRLAATWGAMGFRADPPNAALILTHKGQIRTHVVTLTRPRITNGRVSFRIRAVPTTDEAGHRHTDPLRHGRYARAQLFIDDTAIPPCGSTATWGGACLLPYGAETFWGGSPPGGISLAACEYTPVRGAFSKVLFRVSFVTDSRNPAACTGDVPPVVSSQMPGPIWVANVGSRTSTLLIRIG